MGSRGTFAYLIGDSFSKLGLGMIADGTPIFGLTGWTGTFAVLDMRRRRLPGADGLRGRGRGAQDTPLSTGTESRRAGPSPA